MTVLAFGQSRWDDLPLSAMMQRLNDWFAGSQGRQWGRENDEAQSGGWGVCLGMGSFPIQYFALQAHATVFFPELEQLLLFR
jgi:hypothetical protein